MTVRVPGGEADRWTTVRRVWIGDEKGLGGFHVVENSRAYRDRLVLKLQGIDDGNSAERLRGNQVGVTPVDAPELPEGVFYRTQLLGLEAVDESDKVLGKVDDVVPTGGHDLLSITCAATPQKELEEFLVPWVPEIVLKVDFEAGRIVLRLPPGLQELNRR